MRRKSAAILLCTAVFLSGCGVVSMTPSANLKSTETEESGMKTETTENVIYLVVVKGEYKLNDPDVMAKKKRGIQYCEVATRWGKANGYKEWRYLFIPSKQVMPNSSFMQLAKQFHTL